MSALVEPSDTSAPAAEGPSLATAPPCSSAPSSARTPASFVAALILARALTPTERGTIAFLTVTALVASRTLGAGVPQATALVVAQRPRECPALLANLILFTLGTDIGGVLVVLGLGALGGARPDGVHTGELLTLARRNRRRVGALAPTVLGRQWGSADRRNGARWRARCRGLRNLA